MRFLRPLAWLWTVLLGCTVLALTLAVAARYLVPYTPWAVAPSLTAIDPPDGSSEVRPRTAITLRFSAPMNRVSTEAALLIDPPTPGSFSWSADAAAVTFRPGVALAPAVTYTISLDQGALGRWWRPLAEPATAHFSTAPQPAVVTALPTGAGAPTDTGLAIIFSQPMVDRAVVGTRATPFALRLEPPAPLSAYWADQSTLLIRPETPLAAATRYTAIISPGMSDLRGVELGAPFSWSFTTAWPTVVEQAPADGARWVSPRAPLRMRLAAPLDPALLGQSLRISPAVEGDLTAEVIGATQMITFTPRAGWAYGTTYRVRLTEPPGSDLGDPPDLPWQFSVEPAPRLVAFFPGQGQPLPPGEAIRLVFSTPMDEQSLRAGLSIEPPVADLPLSVSATEVRLRPELRPSTRYTITLAADTRDRSGEPLGAAAVVRLLTAPARPALAAPGAFDGLVSLPVSPPAMVDLATTNLSAIDLSLYPLDQPTLLRALDLRPDERPAFSPERYGQVVARSWRVTPNAPSDQAGTLRLPVGLADGEALPPGAYFLRAVAPEGPRADLVLLASEARLALRQGPGYALVWATDTAGAPLAGLPLALYRSGALVARGQTGPDGVWSQPLISASADAPLLAVSEGDAPAVVRGDWSIDGAATGPPASRSLLFADRAQYRPSDSVQVRGFTRRLAEDGPLALPPVDLPCRLQLRADSVALGPSALCRVEAATGAISGTLALGPRLAPGEYSLTATVGDESLALPIQVAAATTASFELAAAPSSERELLMEVGRGSLPLAGAVVSWSLRLTPLDIPAPPEGFSLGALPLAEELTLSGQARADADGRVRISLPPGDSLARSYNLRASLTDDGPGIVTAQGTLSAGSPLVAVRLPSRLVASNRRSAVDLLALDGLGRPAPGARLKVEVFRAGAPGGPVLTRQAVARSDGQASAELVQLRPGEYELVASAGGQPTTARLWVYGPGFAGWRAADGQLTVVADRDRYSVGEVASLLVAAPETMGNLLLTVERGGLLSAELRPVQAGQVITLPITADMAPGVNVGAIVTTGRLHRVGSTTIDVTGPPAPLEVRIEADQAEVPPGASVPITITAVGDGAPLASELLVAIAPVSEADAQRLQAPERTAALERFTPEAPPASTVADLPTGGAPRPGGAGASAEPAVTVPPPGAIVPIETTSGAPGLVTARVRLPDAPGRWRLTAYATSGPDRVGAGSTVVTTSLPLAYDLVAPTALRPDDRAELSLLIRNSGFTTREVSVALGSEGLTLGPPASATQRLTLGPGGSARLSWEAQPTRGAALARLRLTIATPGLRERLSRELPIVAPTPAARSSDTLVGAGSLRTSLNLGPDASGDLTVAVAPGLRAALADQATALAALANPSVEQRAALALIAAGLARDVPGAEGERWQRTTLAALAELDAAQNEDGGWGWWPGAPSRPFVTAFTLEAQAVAETALSNTRPPGLEAIAYLDRAGPAADASTRAYIAYALAQTERGQASAAQLAEGLRDEQLGADGLAYLALALAPEQSGPALDRLQALAVHEAAPPDALAPTSWPAGETAAMPRGATATTAAAAQALVGRRPSAPEIPGAETTLLAAWGIDGWPTAFEAARVAAALLRQAPAAGGGPVQVSVAGDSIIGGGSTLTATQRATVPLGGLPARPELAVKARGSATYLVSYSLPAAASEPAQHLSLLQELIDPVSGEPLDPKGLRLGQLVGLRVTAVVTRPVLRADLEVALPAGLEPLGVTPRAPFLSTTPSPDEPLMRVGGADLGPGVYTQLVVARAVAAGHYSAPASRLALPHEPGAIAAAPAGTSVTISR